MQHCHGVAPSICMTYTPARSAKQNGMLARQASRDARPATMMRGVVWLANTTSASCMVLGTSHACRAGSADCTVMRLLGLVSAGSWLGVATCAVSTAAADCIAAGGVTGMGGARIIVLALLGQAQQDVRGVTLC